MSDIHVLARPASTTRAPADQRRAAALLRSEWTKLRSVRSTKWSLALLVIIGVGLAVLSCAETRAHWGPGEQFGFDPIRQSLIGVFFAQLVIGTLGILVISAEYGTGTIRASFSAVPHRLSVLAAKVAVFGTVALLVSEAVAFVSFLVGQALLGPPAIHTNLANGTALRAVVASGVYLTLLALLALGLGALIRHTAGGIGAFVGIVLILPIIVSALPNSLADPLQRYLPLTIGRAAISQIPPTHAFGVWGGLVLLACYAAVALAAGAVLTRQRDA